MSNRIRIMLCDDHAVLRAGLRALISQEPDMEAVGEVGTGEEAVKQIAKWSPDVVLMDITLPDMDGIETTRQILGHLPSCRVVFLTMHKQVAYLLSALKAGACGYVLKSDLDTELVNAIRAAYQGEAFVYSAEAAALFRAYLDQGGKTGGLRSLSEMEEHVLKLAAQGRTIREIAELLHISPSSVDTYRGRIMAKLGLERRAHLVRWALQQGLLPEE